MNVGIVANGPKELIPDLSPYSDGIDCWIGVDKGAEYLLDSGISPDIAIGDFDSVGEKSLLNIKRNSKECFSYPSEKNETDLELGIWKAYDVTPDKITFFGVTGGRLDHTLTNMQLLYPLLDKKIWGEIIDKYHSLRIVSPGEYELDRDDNYAYISFIPLTPTVSGITLIDFEYTLKGKTIHWGSSRCVSNQLKQNKGTFSFEEGILLIIKSRDVL